VESRGKRGGARVVYYWAVRRDSADLTPKQVSQLGKLVKEEFGDEKGDV
jgi:hypothetical protein